MQFQSKTAVVLFFSCVLYVLCAQIKTPFLRYDEGFAVFNATRIMDGDVPYKDFWTIYPPGQFYVLAAIFKTFGTNLLVARIYDTIVRFVIVICAYLIAKKITSHSLALLGCAVTALLLGFADSYAYAVFPAMALALLSILSMLQYTQTGQRHWALLAGLLIGLVAFFRWDIGLYTGISVAFTIILSHFFQMAQETKLPVKALLKPSELLVTLFGATLFIVIPCYGYLIYKSGLSNLWTQAVIFPTSALHHEVRWLSYPSLIPSGIPFTLSIFTYIAANSEFSNWLRFYSPLIIYGIAIYDFILSLFKKRIVLNTFFFGTTALTILGVLLFAQALSRYDYIHVLPSSMIAFLVVIPIIRRVVIHIHNLVLKCYFFTAVIVLIILYFHFPVRSFLFSTKNFSPLGCYSHIERASCISISQDQEHAIDYIRLHTQDGESIFVGNQRHDLISINDIGFYFLCNRPCATKYHDLFPGVVTTRSVQEEIVHDIQSKNVRWIVLVNVLESCEPNASAVSSGVLFLDDFIRSVYAPIVKFGNYEIWKRVKK
ncbi:MAG: glycosyltransferase family 39 protein [Bacteroidota bacterium]|jgi:hypothetical protein